MVDADQSGPECKEHDHGDQVVPAPDQHHQMPAHPSQAGQTSADQGQAVADVAAGSESLGELHECYF